VYAALSASLATGCASPGSAGPLTSAAGDRFFVAGYHAYWTGTSWNAYPWDALDQIYFFEIEAGSDGALADTHGWPGDWTELRRRARESGVSLVPTVSMHDPVGFAELFSSPERVERLVDTVTELLAADGDLGGVHLDFEVFEPVDVRVRDGFSGFVARLARTIDELDPSLSLSVFAMAFDDDDVYDERALAEHADFLVVQGYDFHHLADQRAGPLGATRGWGRLNWESVVERFLDLGVPPREIVMAVPLYGYEWPVTAPEPGARTRGVGLLTALAPAPAVVPEMPRARARAAEHGLRRDSPSGVPYYTYRDADGWRQGWFDDAESLRAKYAFVRERGLGGVALFPLAYGDRAVWEDVRSAFSAPRGETQAEPAR
jgi:spore germination protein YaaH